MKELELSKSNVAHDLPDLTAEEMEEMKSNETTVAEDRFLQDVEEGNLPDLDLLGQSTNAVDEPAFNISATAAADPSAQVESTEQHATSWLQEVALSHKLEAHLDQVTENLRDAHYAIVRQAQLLLNDVTATTALVNTSEIAYVNTSNFYRRVGEINEAVLQLSKCAVQKSFELRSTALLSGSHGRSDGASLSPLVEARLASKPWTTCVGGGGGAALTLLSDIYQSIRALEQGGRAVEDVWVAPQSFERATQKYWVNEEHLSEVLLACVAQVPLLVFGKSGRLHDVNEADTHDEDLWQSHAANISSVYFDSPSLDLYNGRIARIEGAKLVRVRWYGEQPKGDGIVFLELKTHHESWVAERSSKQRVAVQEKDMVHVTSSHKTWSMDLAESIVRSASPKSDGKDLSSATELLHQIHELFAELDLRPCVRTCYRRAAFQSSSSNDLRLTIDRDVIVTDETKAPIGAWCLPNETAVKLAATSSVPGAILEVKLNGRNQPASLERLIESGAVRDGYKFSKFLTSVATFHSDRLAILPYWAKDPMFENMFHPGEPSAVQKILCTRTFSNALDGNSESTLSTTAEVNEEPFFRSRGRRSTWIPASRRSKQRKSLAPSKRVKIEPKTYFAAERTFIQWISAALLLITVAAILLSLSNDEGMASGYASGLVLTVLAMVVTLYALVVYCRRLYLLGNGKPYGYVDYIGPAVLAMAVAGGIGASLYVAVYLHNPPAISTAAVIAEPGNCIRHDFTGISLLEYQPSDVVVDEARDMLIIPSQSKLTSVPINMNHTASDLLVLTELAGADMEAVTYGNGTLFALSEDESSSMLLAFEWSHGNYSDVEDLHLVGRWKLKGASNTEGMVYLPDLGGSGAKLLISADGATTVDGVASNILVYDVPTSTPETFVLGVAGDDTTLDATTILPLYQLNAALLSSGIQTAPKISALNYFEDTLYVLHDNARVIRGWDIATATMVSEWITPRVGGEEFDKQWEGLAFQRSAVSSDVIVHMTLDTPPQIWSFAMQESVVSGKTALSFPICAQAF